MLGHARGNARRDEIAYQDLKRTIASHARERLFTRLADTKNARFDARTGDGSDTWLDDVSRFVSKNANSHERQMTIIRTDDPAPTKAECGRAVGPFRASIEPLQTTRSTRDDSSRGRRSDRFTADPEGTNTSWRA